MICFLQGLNVNLKNIFTQFSEELYYFYIRIIMFKNSKIIGYKRKLEKQALKEFAQWIKENYPDVDVVTSIKSLAHRYPDRKNLPSDDHWHIDDVAMIRIYMDGGDV